MAKAKKVTASATTKTTKATTKTTTKPKASKQDAGSIRPVKETLTKTALINLLAEQNEIPRKTAAAVYATLENVLLGSVHPRGVGEFTLPGLLKVTLSKVPARRAGTLVRNPATGEMIKSAGKPASMRVKIRALSKLKAAASPSSASK
jgi:nucleoid DNA-binding protein